STGRPEIVVKVVVRSGDFFKAGSSVSRSHRSLARSAMFFISPKYSPLVRLKPDATTIRTSRRTPRLSVRQGGRHDYPYVKADATTMRTESLTPRLSVRGVRLQADLRLTPRYGPR